MTREEAQNILQLYRPGSLEDRNDPLIAEAWQMLEDDAELQTWFEAEQAFDEQIGQSLTSIEVPQDLKASLLAGMHAHQLQAAAAHSEPAPAPAATNHTAAWWRSPWIGIAAAVALLFVLWSRPSQLAPTGSPVIAQASVPGVLQFLADQIDQMQADSFDKRDPDYGQLQSFLASHGAPAPTNLPPCFQEMPTIGCVTFNYNETKISMICFKRGSIYHLTTAPKTNFPDELPSQPQTYQIKDKAFKLWIEGDQVRIIAVQGTKKDIPEFI